MLEQRLQSVELVVRFPAQRQSLLLQPGDLALQLRTAHTGCQLPAFTQGLVQPGMLSFNVPFDLLIKGMG